MISLPHYTKYIYLMHISRNSINNVNNNQFYNCYALRYKPAGREFDSQWCHWNFSLTILPVALWPWGRLSLYKKWVPDVFPGGKGGRCVRLTTLPTSYTVVMQYGKLNFLESSGPLQACNGTALLYNCYRPAISFVNLYPIGSPEIMPKSLHH
jgi:hypothetical protein